MIKLETKNLFTPRLKSGISKDELSSVNEIMLSAKQKFLKDDLSFKKLPYEYDNLKVDLENATKYAEGMDTIVVIGIGGSDLGARALHRAINSQYHNQLVETKKINQKKIYFSGDTTDPESISNLAEILDFEKTLFLIVSKSGNTIEPSSVFAYFRDLYISKNLDIYKHFVFLTDPKSGTLRDIANTSGYKTLIHGEVGGRFSVLSSVGSVPAHLVNIKVDKLLEGARDLDKHIQEEEMDIVLNYIAAKYLYYKKHNKTISVIMPYQYSLYEVGKWYQQLWGESIGKRLDLQNNEVYAGQTPVALLGPVDQHSQLQLLNEGPNDKFITFIKAENSRQNLNLPENYNGVEQFEFLKGHNFQEILNYELETTAFALTKNQRPNCTITIPQIDEYHLGQIFYFFEVATAYMGYLLNINPIDQPGVELSKNAMYGVLNKGGYEEIKKDFEEYLKS
jgi:glucose-6-phosphate isomerase